MSKKKMIGAYPQTQDHASANTVSQLKMQAAVLPVEGITASLVATTSVTRQDSAAASAISAAAAVGQAPRSHTDVKPTGKATTTGRALPAAQVTAATDDAASAQPVSAKRQTRRRRAVLPPLPPAKHRAVPSAMPRSPLQPRRLMFHRPRRRCRLLLLLLPAQLPLHQPLPTKPRW